MRRKDREITDIYKIEAIIASARYMHLGMGNRCSYIYRSSSAIIFCTFSCACAAVRAAFFSAIMVARTDGRGSISKGFFPRVSKLSPD